MVQRAIKTYGEELTDTKYVMCGKLLSEGNAASTTSSHSLCAIGMLKVRHPLHRPARVAVKVVRRFHSDSLPEFPVARPAFLPQDPETLF